MITYVSFMTRLTRGSRNLFVESSNVLGMRGAGAEGAWARGHPQLIVRWARILLMAN
jgi:hypothetical protein